MGNGVAINVLATIGTILWCVQLIPQIIRNYKVKNCEGFPPLMMFLWASCGIPFGIYFFGIDGSIPLRIQPEVFTAFSTISWAQTLYYPPVKLPRKRIILYVGSFVAIGIGLQAGLIIWLRPLYRRGIHWPMLVIGIIASVGLAAGLIPPYFELFKRKGRVIGINFVFLATDLSGGVFSLLSVVVGDKDIMSMVLYIVVVAMEVGIFTSHLIWYLRMGKSIIKEEKRQKMELESEEESSNSLNIERTQSDDQLEDKRSNNLSVV